MTPRERQTRAAIGRGAPAGRGFATSSYVRARCCNRRNGDRGIICDFSPLFAAQKLLRVADSMSAERAVPSTSLTYEPFYSLREKPFSLSADPRFLYRGSAHKPAFEQLLVGIRRREGLIVLTGRIGTGKTTLCRSVLQHLDRRTFAAFVADPFVSREDLLKTLLVDFGVISVSDLTSGRFAGASRSDLSYLLYEFLDSLAPLQAFAVLIIDEAQNLSLPLLEEIRILSELERREKLLQVVLVGQPELRVNLKLPQMRQVDERVSVRCELKPLDAEGVVGYVSHRLLIAGGAERTVEFTPDALAALHRGSSGVPRLINRICDRALDHAHLVGERHIDTHFVMAALDDLGLDLTEIVQTPSAQPFVTAVPPAVPAGAAAPATVARSEIAFGGELDFGDAPRRAAPRSPSRAKGLPRPRVAARTRWLVSAAASILAASAVVGAAWYAGARAVDAPPAVLPLPERALPATPTSPVLEPPTDPVVLAPPPEEDAGQSSLTEAAPTAAGPARSPRSVAVAGARGSYTILVASFKRPEGAARVVDELTNAGFGARTVEREGGPDGARFLVVMISGYTSAIDVQRDLQQIRALPGGYGDARIVEHE